MRRGRRSEKQRQVGRQASKQAGGPADRQAGQASRAGPRLVDCKCLLCQRTRTAERAKLTADVDEIESETSAALSRRTRTMFSAGLRSATRTRAFKASPCPLPLARTSRRDRVAAARLVPTCSARLPVCAPSRRVPRHTESQIAHSQACITPAAPACRCQSAPQPEHPRVPLDEAPQPGPHLSSLSPPRIRPLTRSYARSTACRRQNPCPPSPPRRLEKSRRTLVRSANVSCRVTACRN